MCGAFNYRRVDDAGCRSSGGANRARYLRQSWPNGHEENGEIVDSSFVGIDKADLIEAEVKNKTARITVKFVSQLITAIRNRSGEVIDGDPKSIHEVTDIWTFAREIPSSDPNWKLVATQTAN